MFFMTMTHAIHLPAISTFTYALSKHHKEFVFGVLELYFDEPEPYRHLNNNKSVYARWQVFFSSE